jgi:outer membrane protein assembly factor BamB
LCILEKICLLRDSDGFFRFYSSPNLGFAMHNPNALGLVFVNGESHIYAVACEPSISPAAVWQWNAPADGGTSSASVAGGTLFVGSDDFNVYAIDANTGLELYKMPTQGFIWSDPVVSQAHSF